MERDFTIEPVGEFEAAAVVFAERRRGRPKGSKTTKAPVVPVVSIRCPKCGSSNRKQIKGSRVATVRAAGKRKGIVYNVIRSKRVRCECGQIFVERVYDIEICDLNPTD